MRNISEIPVLGVAPNWPTRKTLLDWFEETTPWSMDKAVAYNDRTDTQNIRNIPPHTAFGPFGARLRYKAQALALKSEPWEHALLDALNYLMFADQLNYSWNKNFRVLFPDHPQPLRSMNWELMTESMAIAFVLGRIDEGVYQGYLTHAVLNQTFQLKLSYEETHRCGLTFMLRLFADWRGDAAHTWPSYAYDEPIYEAILEQWRVADPEVLKPWLLAACDRHTHQSQVDTETVFHDFAAFPRTPFEILLLFRLRELEGLKNPRLDHPLMEPPFDQLPMAQGPFVPDELILGTIARVRSDWLNFDDVVSLTSIMKFVRPA